MAKSKYKINTILKFKVEIKENNIEEKSKENSILISDLAAKRMARNYCINKLRLY